MRKAIMILMLIVMSFSVFAYSTITVKVTDDITTGNGICERYEQQFEKGDTHTIELNGEEFVIKFIGWDLKTDDYNPDNKYYVGQWTLNGEEGEYLGDIYREITGRNKQDMMLNSHLLHDNNDKPTGGNAYFNEQDSYPADCVGMIENQWGSKMLIQEFHLEEGWHLLPFEIHIPHCQSTDELCEDDLLVEYHYNPLKKEYTTMKALESYYNANEDKFREEREKKLEEFRSKIDGLGNQDLITFDQLDWLPAFIRDGNQIVNYFEDDINPGIEKTARWVYVSNPGKIYKTYHEPRRQFYTLGIHVMFKGWNFVGIGPEMVFNERWQENPLSIDQIKGDCEIEKIYLYGQDKWNSISAFSEPDIGKGIVIKVAEDCRLGIRNSLPNVPQLPE
jgi:hypothetical protein